MLENQIPTQSKCEKLMLVQVSKKINFWLGIATREVGLDLIEKSPKIRVY